jgi:hypothetical protein
MLFMHHVTQIDGFDRLAPSNPSISVTRRLNRTSAVSSPSFQSASDQPQACNG